MNYYNEFDPKAAAALRQLIKDGLIPNGDVDTRSIVDVRPDDLRSYTQCHFFAGIGGWPRALALAGWPSDRKVWTGSCPCQPFSTAGKQRGTADERHLWPIWFNLIRECKPPVVFGEQVSAAVSHGWLDGVSSNLEEEGYAFGTAVLPACSVNAPHKRDRLWFVAISGYGTGRHFGITEGREDPQRERPTDTSETLRSSRHVPNTNTDGCTEMSVTRLQDKEHNTQPRCTLGNSEHDGWNGCQVSGSNEAAVRDGSEGENCTCRPSGAGSSRTISCGTVADFGHSGSQGYGKSSEQHGSQGREVQTGHPAQADFWSDTEWIICGDGKARRIPSVESGIRLLAHGIPERVGLLRAAGNAIVPEVAARFIQASI